MGSKIKKKHAVHKCEAPMIARKVRYIENRKGCVLQAFTHVSALPLLAKL